MQLTTPESVGVSSERLARVDARMQRYVDEGKLAGLITTVARAGETVHLGQHGLMDAEAGKAMQLDAIFRIMSMTKPVTSVAAMMLYEEGHFNLNTPIHEFLPAFAEMQVFLGETDEGLALTDAVRPITVRHLLTHTSGLSYGAEPNHPVDRLYQKARERMRDPNSDTTLEDVIQAVAELPLVFQPGTNWRYSFSIDVLGRLIEVVSGQSLDTFFQTRIFEPLAMVDTAFWVPPEKATRLTAVYGPPDEGRELKIVESAQESRFLQRPPFLMGGGGLVSTVPDYARFAQMLTNGGILDGIRVLSPTSMALFRTNLMQRTALEHYRFRQGRDSGYGYSLGVQVLMDVAPTGMAGSVGEFGWLGAYSTYFWIDPAEALYGLLMTQFAPNQHYPINSQFKQLTYQALVKRRSP